MADYPAMYRKLLGAQADAVDGLKTIMENLIRAHRLAEEMYINAAEPRIVALKREDGP